MRFCLYGILIMFFCGLLGVHASNKRKGLFIAGLGIAGSGKSSTFRELQQLIPGSVAFLEPDEDLWPEAITQKHLVGSFSYNIAFRSLRVPQVYKADEERNKGNIALLDSYYDKILFNLLGKPNSNWIISPSDPYFKVFAEMTRIDAEILPDPDVVVLFEIPYDNWDRFTRNTRHYFEFGKDRLAIYESYKYIEDAILNLAHRKNIKVVRLHQTHSHPRIQAKHLLELLIEQKIIDETTLHVSAQNKDE